MIKGANVKIVHVEETNEEDGGSDGEDEASTSCLMAEKKEIKINYKSGGKYWVMDSGCSQHMTGNSCIFTTLEEGDHIMSTHSW